MLQLGWVLKYLLKIMNLDFFKKVRILDGGMGQELLARGMKPKGTLWSASALIDEKYHKLLLCAHNSFQPQIQILFEF